MGAATKSEPVPSISSGLDFRASHKDLSRALALLSRIADRKSTMPVLAQVAIRVDSTHAYELVATDLQTSLSYRGQATWTTGGGSFCVPAKQLADIVKGLPSDGDVTLARSGASGLKAEAGGVDTVLIGFTARDFPKIPATSEIPFVDVDGKAFADTIERVLFSVCRDETRFQLSGVFLETEGNWLRAITTDGHRLTLAKMARPEGFYSKGVIIPGKAAREIIKLVRAEKQAACAIALVADKDKLPGHLHVRCGAFTLSAKLIDAQFPPYWQVVPTDHTKLVTVKVKALQDALKRAKGLTCETRGVRLDVADGKLKLTCDHPDLGTTTESMPAESAWVESGGKATIGVNTKYLAEAIAEVDCEHVTLALGRELDPILVRGTECAVSYAVKDSYYLGVIMPMRI